MPCAGIKHNVRSKKQQPLESLRYEIIQYKKYRQEGYEAIGRKQHGLFVKQTVYHVQHGFGGVEVFGHDIARHIKSSVKSAAR